MSVYPQAGVPVITQPGQQVVLQPQAFAVQPQVVQAVPVQAQAPKPEGKQIMILLTHMYAGDEIAIITTEPPTVM